MTFETSDIDSIYRGAQRIEDPEERSAYVRRACESVAGAEKVVLDLLRIWDSLGGPDSEGRPDTSRSEPGLTTITAPLSDASPCSDIIGHYKLLKRIGEGGFGIVFLAEQREPVRRNVALKIIKPGMDTRRVIARFEVERQALALMDHPNIAKVFDAGATETGRPYFVMELVNGSPITVYCDDHQLSIRERLDLFVQVCDAVQHAHTRGIIHRDLKPGNVLVSTQDGRHFAKVIDFGIAKASYATLTDKTLFTAHGQFMGTPAYMSPEQIDGLADTDTRTDVYSLGVLLYELLTGSTPFSSEELSRGGIGEMHRMVREVEPPVPSARISLAAKTASSIASNRATDPQRLHAIVRGELDWIVMKCLEKSRARRYESVGSLAADIGRYAQGDAVLAAPPSRVYRLQKFARKHRVGVVAGMTVAAALILGLGATLIGLRSAVQARDVEAKARREAEAARQVASDNEQKAAKEAAKSRAALEFVTDMFGSVDPEVARGHAVTVTEVLDPAAAKVAQSFEGDAEGEAAVRYVLGQAYAHLARYPEALREFGRAWELRRDLKQESDPQSLSLMQNWAATLLAAGDVARARDMLQRVWEQRSAQAGPASLDALAAHSLLAFAKQLGGDLDGATADIRSVLQDQERTLGPDDLNTLESMRSLADMLDSAGKFQEALTVAHEAETRAASAYGSDSPAAISAASIEAECLLSLSRDEEARTLLERVVNSKEKLYGPNHPETLVSLDLLGGTLSGLGQHERAITLRRAVLDRAKKTLGEDNATTLTYMNNLAQTLRSAGRLADAEPIYRRTIQLRREKEGPRAQGTLVAMSNLGLCLMQRKAPAEALPLFQESVDGLRATLPADHWMIGVALLNLGKCQAALRDYGVAETTLLDAHARLVKSFGPTHGRTDQARAALAELYDAWERPDQAARWRGSK